ncbi:MAG: hypothetical protein AABM29_05780 [Actinomycetota bacterium]
MGCRLKSGLLTTVACLAFGLLAITAQASFHIMQIREVQPGPTGDTNLAFVELQMWSSGQNLVAGKQIVAYDNSGNVKSTFTFPGNAANAQNQRTILVGGTSVGGADFTTAGFNGTSISLAGGAVCFVNPSAPGTAIDCASWNGFSGAAMLPTPGPGAPVQGVTDGKSLTRTIARGCPTLLDGADDTNDSATDFSVTDPSPRNNAATPTETPCGGSSNDNNAPNTKIKKRPPNRTTDHTPTFKFKSTEAGSTFKCKVDGKKFKKCRSPKTLKSLDPGAHTFKVKATDKAGNTDKSPAKDTFKVLEN